MDYDKLYKECEEEYFSKLRQASAKGLLTAEEFDNAVDKAEMRINIMVEQRMQNSGN